MRLTRGSIIHIVAAGAAAPVIGVLAAARRGRSAEQQG
jgi:hypothetical protein